MSFENFLTKLHFKLIIIWFFKWKPQKDIKIANTICETCTHERHFSLVLMARSFHHDDKPSPLDVSHKISRFCWICSKSLGPWSSFKRERRDTKGPTAPIRSPIARAQVIFPLARPSLVMPFKGLHRADLQAFQLIVHDILLDPNVSADANLKVNDFPYLK